MMSCRNMRTTLIPSSSNYIIQLELWCLVMDSILSHELFLFFTFQIINWYHFWIGHCNFSNLIIKCVFKFFLNIFQTEASSWMSNHQKFFKIWIDDVIFPNMRSMSLHSLTKWNLLVCNWILKIIWIHNKNRDSLSLSPLNLWKHCP
jgi:hypothetical protein